MSDEPKGSAVASALAGAIAGVGAMLFVNEALSAIDRRTGSKLFFNLPVIVASYAAVGYMAGKYVGGRPGWGVVGTFANPLTLMSLQR
jgi:hypothetical protein